MKTIKLSIIFLISFLFLCSCNPGPRNTPIDKVLSPDKQYAAYVFNRNGGETSGLNTHVSLILNKNNPDDKEGNIFICDSGDGNVKSRHLYKKGGPRLKIKWSGNKKLKIYYPKGSRIYKARNKLNRIRIQYYDY